MIDTHAHLNHPKFGDDLDATIERAKDAGIQAIITVGFDLPSSEVAVKLSERYCKYVWAAVGIHPHDALYLTNDAIARLRELSQSPTTIAIGEIGLDFYRNLSPRDAQLHAFEQQLILACELCLPIILHIRNAYQEALDLLRHYAPLPINGVAHCFSGDWAIAEQLLSLGLDIGITGTITFRHNESLREVISRVDMSKLLLETDAPYLAPVPYRGKRNEPAYLVRIASAVAQVRGITVDEVAMSTTANAKHLFKLDI